MDASSTSQTLNYSDVKHHIVNWLNDYILKSGAKGFVLGVSGGIDSAVVSTLCAMTGKPLLVIEMPIHQGQAEVDRAQDHINWLKSVFPNVSSKIVDLTKTYDAFSESLGARDVFIGGEEEIATDEQYEFSLSNSRSRFRMVALYQYAGMHKLLVAGTGNKVEDFGIGFYTKYGDGGVDISPIADLMKSEVYNLGSELNIINSILTAAPTDGLHDDGRTDEDQIGATYEELEWAMTYVSENGFHFNEEATGSRLHEVLCIYKKFNDQNKHKMDPIPICDISELR